MPTDLNVHRTSNAAAAEPILAAATLAALAKTETSQKARAAVTTERVRSTPENIPPSDVDLEPPRNAGEISVAEVLEILHRLQMELRKDRALSRWLARDAEMAFLGKQAAEIRDGAEDAFISAMVGGGVQLAALGAGIGLTAHAALKSSPGTQTMQKPITQEMAQIEKNIAEKTQRIKESPTYRNLYEAEIKTNANRLVELEGEQARILSADYGQRAQKTFTWSQLFIQGGQAPAQICNAVAEYISKGHQAASIDAEAAAKKQSYARQEQEEAYQDAVKAMEEVRNVLGQIINAEAKTIERIVT